MAEFVEGLALLLHVAGAMAWFGGLLFSNLRFVPAMKAAGPAAGPVQMALLRQGGLVPYFASAGGTTIVAGSYLYVEDKVWTWGDNSGMMLTLGAAIALLTYVVSMVIMVPTERRMKAIVAGVTEAPTAEQSGELRTLTMKASRTSQVATVFVGIVVVLMDGRLMLA